MAVDVDEEGALRRRTGALFDGLDSRDDDSDDRDAGKIKAALTQRLLLLFTWLVMTARDRDTDTTNSKKCDCGDEVVYLMVLLVVCLCFMKLVQDYTRKWQ